MEHASYYSLYRGDFILSLRLISGAFLFYDHFFAFLNHIKHPLFAWVS